MTDSPVDMFEKLDACIHCGMCLPVCPTYRVTGSEAESPRGRLFLMRELEQGRLESPQQLATHLDPCLGCLACVTACPSGVEYDKLLLASRAKLLPHQPFLKRLFRRTLLRYLLPNPLLLHFLARLVRFSDRTGLHALMARLGGSSLLGKMTQFVPSVQAGASLKPGSRFGQNRRGRVALFTGCIMNAVYVQTHQATIHVLTQNGYEVVIPEQTCCGALAHHSGESDIAEALAQQNVRDILAVEPDWIVVNAAGCGSTLKEIDHILDNSPESQLFAQKTIDILALLVQHPLEGILSPVPLKVTYHAACHLHHAQQVKEEPYQVLRQIPGIELIPLQEAEMCCGSAGVYNLAHPQLSWAILKEKMAAVKKTGAEVVLAGNPGCMLQLEAGIRSTGLPMQVLHPIELIHQAYGAGSLSGMFGPV